MGEWFKDSKRSEEVEKVEVLISDFQDLLRVYDALSNRINETKTQGFETIMPIRTKLMGSGETPDETGLIGNVRRSMKLSRIEKIPLGMNMKETMEKIEEFEHWNDRYSQYLEEHIEGLQTICKSGFKQIKEGKQREELLKREIARLKEQLSEGLVAPAQILPEPEPVIKETVKKAVPVKKAKPVKEPEPEEEVEDDEPEESYGPIKPETFDEETGELTAEDVQKINPEFKRKINEFMIKYISATDAGDTVAAGGFKTRMYRLAGKNVSHIRYVDDVITSI